MIHDLVNDGGYVALKWKAEHREGCQKPAQQQKTTDDDEILSALATQKCTQMHAVNI